MSRPDSNDVDVAVVGAGPAGAAAARAAAALGARTVLLEREQLPRYKRCGGGLIGASQAAVREAGVDLDALSRDVVGRITFTSRGRAAFTRGGEPFLPMVLRSELDAALVDVAVAAGAEVRTGVTVTAYEPDGDGVVVRTRDGDLRARRGRRRRRLAAAAPPRTSASSATRSTSASRPSCRRRRAATGPAGCCSTGGRCPGRYGWVFPKGGTLTVGVIGDRARSEPLRAYYRSFVASLGLDLADAAHDGGHLTRVRAPGSPLVRGRVLVAGDAAGLLEPWTREGISFALRSGALAGAAAAQDPAAYPAQVEALLGADVAAGRRALAAFGAHPRVVHEVMRSLPGMWGLFSRLVSGRTSLAEQLERRSIRSLVSVLGG